MYDIYGDCVSDMCASTNADSVYRTKVPPKPDYIATDSSGTSRRLQRITTHGPDACIDSAAASGYLNRPEVWEAIHVKDPEGCWSVCSQHKGWTYQSTRPNLPRDTYPLLIENINVVIYNGDWDACVPYTDNEGWTESMGLPVKSSWHPWTYTSTSGNENQVAGYAVEYEVSNDVGSFEFITVKGGRHEVPETSPAQALEMLDHMFNNARF